MPKVIHPPLITEQKKSVGNSENHFFQVVAGFQKAHGPLTVGTKSGLLCQGYFLERGMLLSLKVWGTRPFLPIGRLKVETGSSACQGAVNYWETKESKPVKTVNIHPILLCCEAQLAEINAPKS